MEEEEKKRKLYEEALARENERKEKNKTILESQLKKKIIEKKEKTGNTLKIGKDLEQEIEEERNRVKDRGAAEEHIRIANAEKKKAEKMTKMQIEEENKKKLL